MAAIQRQIEVDGIRVEIVRKDIKHLYLRIHSPDGQVRASVPRCLGDEAVHRAIVSRLDWIRRRQAAFRMQPREKQRALLSGEHYFLFGRRYRLDVIEHLAPPAVRLRDNSTIELSVRPGTLYAKRLEVLNQWYRERLRDPLPGLVARWEERIAVRAREVRIKRMTTRWGTCNIKARRIWLNLELATKPLPCLEYVLVHELVHLLERRHNDRFHALMDRFMPTWRVHRDVLNRNPPDYPDGHD